MRSLRLGPLVLGASLMIMPFYWLGGFLVHHDRSIIIYYQENSIFSEILSSYVQVYGVRRLPRNHNGGRPQVFILLGMTNMRGILWSRWRKWDHFHFDSSLFHFGSIFNLINGLVLILLLMLSFVSSKHDKYCDSLNPCCEINTCLLLVATLLPFSITVPAGIPLPKLMAIFTNITRCGWASDLINRPQFGNKLNLSIVFGKLPHDKPITVRTTFILAEDTCIFASNGEVSQLSVPFPRKWFKTLMHIHIFSISQRVKG